MELLLLKSLTLQSGANILDLKGILEEENPCGSPQSFPCLFFFTRKGHGTNDWFKIGKGVRQGCILSLCFFNLYAESVSSVQLLSHVRLFATPRIAAHQASLSITNSQSSLKLMSIESLMPSSHLILCCPLLFLPSIPFSIRVFSNESTLRMRWPKYWSFSFSINPSKEIPGLISFRMDWLDLLAVQGTLKSLLQHHYISQLPLWLSRSCG